MRASDADRDRYAAILQEAFVDGRLTRAEYDERLDAVLSAKTYSELEPLVADLPADNLPVPRPDAPLVPVSSGPPMVAVFAGVERKGVWAAAQDNYAVALFGGVEIDLRAAQIPAAGCEIHAFAFFGGVDITIPPGMAVDVTGVGIFGGFARSGPVTAPDPARPVIRVSGFALFGGVSVKEAG